MDCYMALFSGNGAAAAATPKRCKQASTTESYIDFLREKQKDEADIQRQRLELDRERHQLERREREAAIAKDQAMTQLLLQLLNEKKGQ